MNSDRTGLSTRDPKSHLCALVKFYSDLLSDIIKVFSLHDCDTFSHCISSFSANCVIFIMKYYFSFHRLKN